MSCLGCKQADIYEPIPDPCILRILAINDVYLLDNFAHFATARKVESVGPNLTIGTLAGDFVSPSLLSTMDKGVGIVDCMGAAGVNYVCFGNHENDIKFSELKQRIKESKFEWINTNMPNLPLSDLRPLPKYAILEVKAVDQTRRVALLGLISDDPVIYQDGRFENCVIEPVNESVERWTKELKEKERVDVVIPLTHQDMKFDRLLAQKDIVPVILGGHDHVVYRETVNGCKIVKAGINLENIAIVDIIWNSPTATQPFVNITLKPYTSYAPDASVTQLAAKHKYVLDQLEKAELFGLPEYHRLSSAGVCEQPASMVTYLLTIVKNIMKSDCVLICGGNIRGRKDYSGKPTFSYADLKNEFFYDMNVIVLPLPGSVIAETVEWSRSGSYNSPPDQNDYYMQTDSEVKYYSRIVTEINGSILDPKKMYNVTVNYLAAFKNLDNVLPLVKYVTSQIELNNPAFLKDLESTVELKNLLIGHFSKLVLFNMLSADKVLAIDQNYDGVISKEEFKVAAKKFHGDDVSDLLVDNLFNIADLDGNGTIDKAEITELLKFAGQYKEAGAIEETLNSFSAWCSQLGRNPIPDSTVSNTDSMDFSDVGSNIIRTITLDGVSVDDITGLSSNLIKRVSFMGSEPAETTSDDPAVL